MVDGLTAPDQVVAHYAAPSLTTAGRPGPLRIAHGGAALTISWSPASAATGYQVLVAQRNGVQHVSSLPASKHSVRFTGIVPTSAGTVTVVARGPTGKLGPARSGSFRALKKPFTVLRAFHR